MATECGYSGSHLHFRRLISTSDIHIPDLCHTHTDATLWTIGSPPTATHWVDGVVGAGLLLRVLQVSQVRDLWPCYGVSLIGRTCPLR